MSSRKDTSTDDESALDVVGNSPHKKHKRHKHKKHRRRKDRGQDTDPDGGGSDQDVGKHSLKLKFKFGAPTTSEARSNHVSDRAVSKVEIPDAGSDEDNQHIEGGYNFISFVEDIPGPAAVSSDISDEDAWLEALESGKLDEYDELRRMKDPSLMTARQRSLLESKLQRETNLQDLFSLPSGFKEKEMTEEMLQKRELRAKKRRQQAKEKREKDKKQTIDRLLRKQDSKPKGGKSKNAKKTEVPKVTYVNNQHLVTLSFPVGIEFPLPKQIAKDAPVPVLCGVAGCANPKRYTCSKTGVPLCSLQCYKRSLISSGLEF